MNLARIFDEALESLEQYSNTPEAQISSAISQIREHRAYQEIVRMGLPALPLIKALYDSGDKKLDTIKTHIIPSLVREIMGDDFQIPPEIQGKVAEIGKHTKAWLNTYLNQ